MREKERIKRILKLIEKIWLEAPDLRLGQLQNFAGFKDGDNWNTEDDETEMFLQLTIDVRKLQKHFKETGEILCKKCNKPFKKISKYIHQLDCECFDKNFRLSIG